MLSVAPILLGTLLGIAASFGVEQAMNLIGKDIPGRHEILFYYHPLVFVVTVFSAFLTVLCSAWLPARKLSRLTPLEAIRNTGDLALKKKKRSRILVSAVWHRRGACRKFPEGQEEGDGHLHAFPDPFFFGIHPGDVLFYFIRDQHQIYLL